MSLKNDEKKVIPVVKTGQKVQIGLPKLCNYDDDDDEDEEEQTPKPTLKNLNPVKTVEKKAEEKPRSGLLGLLPPPKSSQNPFLKKTAAPIAAAEPTSSLSTKSSVAEETSKPATTTSSGLLLPRHMMGSKFPVKIADQDTEPSGKPTPTVKSKTPIELPVTINKRPLIPEEDPDPFPDEDDKEEDDDDDEDYQDNEEGVGSMRNEAEAATSSSQAQVALDKDAMLRLCGTQGKKRRMEEIEFTEVSASAIVGDNQAELMKQVTCEYKPPSNKEYFTSSSRRTHHVTYLAKVAIERDQELRASWSQNKFNQKMSRQKYGF